MGEIHVVRGPDAGPERQGGAGWPAGSGTTDRLPEASPADALAALDAARRMRGRLKHLPLVAESAAGGAAGAPARYRWDRDTEILVARLPGGKRGAAAGAVELEGADGSWLSLELRDTEVCGVQVAVWPTVRRRSVLTPPADAPAVRVRVPAAAPLDDVTSLALGGPPPTTEVEVDTDLAADADGAGRTFHFRVGTRRRVHAVRVGRDILLDLDEAGALAGIWLCNVPPLLAGPLA